MVRTAFVRSVEWAQAGICWRESVPGVAGQANIATIVSVLLVGHSPVSISPAAVARCVEAMARGRRSSERGTRQGLAKVLKVAVKSLQGNIRKLEKTGASPLLIAARKKQLARMKEQLSKIGPA